MSSYQEQDETDTSIGTDDSHLLLIVENPIGERIAYTLILIISLLAILFYIFVYIPKWSEIAERSLYKMS